jgi:hypothetical protein
MAQVHANDNAMLIDKINFTVVDSDYVQFDTNKGTAGNPTTETVYARLLILQHNTSPRLRFYLGYEINKFPRDLPVGEIHKLQPVTVDDPSDGLRVITLETAYPIVIKP